jgi:hypothetical protein
MKPRCPVLVLTWLLGAVVARAGDNPEETVSQLQAAFTQYSGARLVFAVKDLPEGSYYEVMPSLAAPAQARAAHLVWREVRKYPPRYLEKIGLRTIGIFAACIARQGDGFRPYDEVLKGYRYFGIYNGRNAVAAAYYSDGQLPLTFHHEVFHHVDVTRPGRSGDTTLFSQDERLETALSGKEPYTALTLTRADLAGLQKLSGGGVLEKAVSKYSEKNVGEDKAETARYLMNTLPDALVQMATRPQLAGSQRLLHVLHKYQSAVTEGPGPDWFVAVALGRIQTAPVPDERPAATPNPATRRTP